MKIFTLMFAFCLGCLLGLPALQAQQYVSFTVNQPAAPQAAFSYVSQNLTYTMTDQSAGTGLSYAWTFGDGNTSTLQNPVHTYATEGNYTICLNLTDANNCSSSTCDTILVVGLSQNLPGLVLEVAPNPFSGQTTVQYQLIESATITITVYDLQGAKVQVQSQGLQTPGQYRHAIGTGLAAGSYLLVFEADGKQLSRRIVKAQ